MEKERIKEAIAKMEKGLNNPQIGEAQKDSLRKKIASLKGQIKEVEPKAKAEVKVIKKKIEKIDLEIAKSVEPKAKRKPARAKTTRAKSTEPKSSDNCTMTLAKEIRKEGETYTQALKRASSLMKEAKAKGLRASELAKKPKRTKKVITSTKRKKAAATETPKRKKKVITSAKRKKAAMREVPDTTNRGLAADKKREALPVGKRVSKGGANQFGKSSGGNTYYEYRRNRADRNAKRKFAKGGEMEKLTAQTYKGKDAISGNINEIAFYTAENGTIIQLVSVRDASSVSGAMYYVTINGRGLYAREYREDAYELYRDEKAKYNTKMAKGGEVDNTPLNLAIYTKGGDKKLVFIQTVNKQNGYITITDRYNNDKTVKDIYVTDLSNSPSSEKKKAMELYKYANF
jgi:hypothetical protein